METRFLWLLVVLSMYISCAFALNETEENKNFSLIVRDYDVRTFTTERSEPATTEQTYRQARWRPERNDRSVARAVHDMEYHDDEMAISDDHHHDDMVDTKAMGEAKNDYWGGYYDFLINEGSYKFWAVFQLATAALLIYSGFAALYYAKVNPQTGDYDEDIFYRRKKRSLDKYGPPHDRPFFGFEPRSLQRILDAIAGELD